MYQIDMEKLVTFLPLHLLGVLTSSNRDEDMFRYLLCGIRLLYSLCDLAPRHAKVEQVSFSNACQSFVLSVSILLSLQLNALHKFYGY